MNIMPLNRTTRVLYDRLSPRADDLDPESVQRSAFGIWVIKGSHSFHLFIHVDFGISIDLSERLLYLHSVRLYHCKNLQI